MSRKEKYTIRFADISVEFRFPTEIDSPKEFEEFRIEDEEMADVKYEIELLDHPLQMPNQSIASYRGMQVYLTDEGILRDFAPLRAEDGCQVACLTRESGKNTLYYPKSRWDFYSEELHLLHLIGIEEVLVKYHALLLHSSVVKVEGYTVLFSGPSGIGKSTQARLWETCLGAEIINGDRCVIREKDGQFWGGGSPWSGTSGIYSRKKAPIKGIFILKQGTVNSVRRLKAEAFFALYSQCIVNAWDKVFVEQITGILTKLLDRCPVYELTCRPDKEAVELAYHTLFERRIGDGANHQCTD